MLRMKNHFDISVSIEIREVDIAGVACIAIFVSFTAVTFTCSILRLIYQIFCNKLSYFIGNVREDHKLLSRSAFGLVYLTFCM